MRLPSKTRRFIHLYLPCLERCLIFLKWTRQFISKGHQYDIEVNTFAIHTKTASYKMEISWRSNSVDEVFDWLTENISSVGHRWDLDWDLAASVGGPFYDGPKTYAILFLYEEDAMAFKLMWYDRYAC